MMENFAIEVRFADGNEWISSPVVYEDVCKMFDNIAKEINQERACVNIENVLLIPKDVARTCVFCIIHQG